MAAREGQDAQEAAREAGIMTAPDVTTSDITPGDGPRWVSLAPWGYSKYEAWSAGGYGLGEDQWPIRRQTTGTRLKVTLGTHGYPQVKPYNDHGKQKTVTVHSLILLANVGKPEPGQETRHLDSDPLNYRWAPGRTEEEIRAAGGNLMYGTKPQNHADQVKAGTAVLPPPTFPCVNHTRCGAMVLAEGRRCQDCMQDAGRRAAALLTEGTPLKTATRRLGYTNEVHVHALARQHGGYRGSLAEARAQRRPALWRRVLGRFRRGGRR
jgi:hypothetical protein